MLGHRELTTEDYADILKRRIWLIIICTVVCLAVGIGATFVVPKKFQSQTLILVEQQRVPEDYVKPVVVEDLNARLASMKEQILSRSRIEPIIRQFDLFDTRGANMDDRLAATQKAIGVNIIPSRGSNGLPGFYVTFKANDARTAQKVCTEITQLFVSANLSAREQSAEGTTEFLKQQLDDSKKSLDAQDAKLAAFQERYFGMLPDQQQSNTQTLQTLTTQLDAATQAMNRQQQEVTFLQAMVSQQTRELQTTESTAPGVASVDERRTQLNALLQQRQTLETEYTPDYPDVVEVSRKIAHLQALIAHSSAEPAPAPAPTPVAAMSSQPDSPQLAQLKSQLRAAQQSMAGMKQQQARIEQQIHSYESRIASSPQVEEQYKEITRDHESALQFYDSLLAKMNESSMATALLERQQDEHFVVMDAANLPDEPIFPKRLIFGGGGLAGGLFLGILLAGLLEYRDTSLRSERDVWAFTKLPTLAVISHVDGLPKVSESRGFWKHFSRTNKPMESAL